MRNNNKSLFWYGVRARIMKAFGVMFILGGAIGWIVSYWVTVVGFVIGIILLSKGASSEYDYKRKGGHIIYRD